MLFVGIYLADKPKKPSSLALLELSNSKPKLRKLENVFSDNQILELIRNVDYLAINAPLVKGSISKGYRIAEKQLISWGLRVTTPPLIKDLVLRAQSLLEKIGKNVKVIEVHPRSSAIMLGFNAGSSVFNQHVLEKIISTNGIAVSDKHQFNALISAYTAYLYHKKLTRRVGEDGTFIALPPSRKIKLAVFDMDGTLTKPTSSWEHIHRKLGTWENGGQKYLKKFLSGSITYEKFASLDTAEWKGVGLKKIAEIANKVEYNPGVAKIMAYCIENKIEIAIISGGLSVISNKIVDDFKVRRVFINDLISDGGVLTGKVKINVSFNAKLEIYKKLLKELGLNPYQVMTVGDTNGDMPLFENSGLAVTINPLNDEVRKAADFEVKSLAEIIGFIKQS